MNLHSELYHNTTKNLRRFERGTIRRRVRTALKRATSRRVEVRLPPEYNTDERFERLCAFLNKELGIPMENMCRDTAKGNFLVIHLDERFGL